jgi:hypothetical protein
MSEGQLVVIDLDEPAGLGYVRLNLPERKML